MSHKLMIIFAEKKRISKKNVSLLPKVIVK